MIKLVNHRKETENEFETLEEAQEKKNDMISLGMDSQDLEIIENGSEPTEAKETKESEPKTAEMVDEGLDETAETIEEAVQQGNEDRMEKAHKETIQQARQRATGAGEVLDEEQFVTEIKGVPDTFVVQMGDSVHIKKTGYYYLAAQMGLEVQTEPLNPTWEGDSETASWRGIVREGDKEWSNVGTAHLEHEDMQDAEANLDELAATRAACRSLSMATGTGVASMEEMIGGDENDQSR